VDDYVLLRQAELTKEPIVKIHFYKKINKKERDMIDLQVKGYFQVVGYVTYSEYGKIINAYILKRSNGYDLVFADGPLFGSYIGKWFPSYLDEIVQDINTNDPIPWGPSK